MTSTLDTILEYNIIGLAIGSAIAIVSTDLFHSLTTNIVMPIISFLLRTDEWQDANISLGEHEIWYGRFIATLIYTLLMLGLVILFIRYLIVPLINKKKQDDKENKLECTFTIDK